MDKYTQDLRELLHMLTRDLLDIRAGMVALSARVDELGGSVSVASAAEQVRLQKADIDRGTGTYKDIRAKIDALGADRQG